MLLRILAAASATLALLITGCASPRGMAKLDDTASVAKPTKNVYLLTVTLKNTHTPAYQPRLSAVKIAKITGRETYNTLRFEPDLVARSESNRAEIGCSYLLRLEIEPGNYVIMGLDSWGQAMIMTGEYFTPLGIHLTVPANAPGIRYLGHIEAVVRAHKEGEFRACSTLPTQEQRLTGAFSGTFDVAITDQWEIDSVKFGNKFPTLKNAKVQKAVIPPFNREYIQRWWDKNLFNELP